MSATRRAVVIDDERLARAELCALLADEPSVAVVGEAATVDEAVDVMRREQPDLIFLDIQLGAQTGFDLLERVAVTCDVIFVTAFDQHAVRAFEVNAIDYLLKPVRPDRLGEALERLDNASPGSARVPDDLDRDDRLFVRDGERWRFLKVDAITAIQAAGDYSRVRTADGGTILLKKPLREWETRLPNRLFRRIHRSAIVNLDCVDRVEEWSGQTFHVYIRGLAEPIPMSRRYAARLKQ